MGVQAASSESHFECYAYDRSCSSIDTKLAEWSTKVRISQACSLIRNFSAAGNPRSLDGLSFPPTPEAVPRARRPLPRDPHRAQGVVSPLRPGPNDTPSQAVYS